MKTNLVILLLIFYSNNSFSQCIADGPRNAVAFTNNASIGTVTWINTGNIINSNNTRATAGAFITALSSSTTNYLVATNFGFNIPLTANICGIEIDIERRAQGLLIGSSIRDNNVRIVKNGTILGNNHANGGLNWPSADGYITLGNNSDAWGATWTPAEINANNFGIAYSVRLNAGIASLFLSAEIDHIQITVYYEIPLPIELINFEGERKDNNTVKIDWATSSEINNDYFTIERSLDAINWEEREKIDGAENSNTNLFYSFKDENNSSEITYYRLKQTDFDGNYKYSDIINAEPASSSLDIYPNPTDGIITLNSKNNIDKIEVINMIGKIVYTSDVNSNSKQLDLSHLPKSTYFIKTSNHSTSEYLKFILN